MSNHIIYMYIRYKKSGLSIEILIVELFIDEAYFIVHI